MARKDVWKGYDEDSIKDLGFDDFIKLTSSRNRRTLERVKYNPRLKKLMSKARNAIEEGNSGMIKTHVREAIILPSWVGLTFGVYNGKEFKKVDITVKKVGMRLGDFSHSTSRVLHSGPGVGATRGSKVVALK